MGMRLKKCCCNIPFDFYEMTGDVGVIDNVIRDNGHFAVDSTGKWELPDLVQAIRDETSDQDWLFSSLNRTFAVGSKVYYELVVNHAGETATTFIIRCDVTTKTIDWVTDYSDATSTLPGTYGGFPGVHASETEYHKTESIVLDNTGAVSWEEGVFDNSIELYGQKEFDGTFIGEAGPLVTALSLSHKTFPKAAGARITLNDWTCEITYHSGTSATTRYTGNVDVEVIRGDWNPDSDGHRGMSVDEVVWSDNIPFDVSTTGHPAVNLNCADHVTAYTCSEFSNAFLYDCNSSDEYVLVFTHYENLNSVRQDDTVSGTILKTGRKQILIVNGVVKETINLDSTLHRFIHDARINENGQVFLAVANDVNNPGNNRTPASSSETIEGLGNSVFSHSNPEGNLPTTGLFETSDNWFHVDWELDDNLAPDGRDWFDSLDDELPYFSTPISKWLVSEDGSIWEPMRSVSGNAATQITGPYTAERGLVQSAGHPTARPKREQ